MSQIEQLIQQHCPDGVEHLPLREVCDDFIVPMRDRPEVFDGETPWCRIEDIESMSLNGSKSGLGVSDDVIRKMNLKVMPTGTVLASCSASLGTYAIVSRPLVTNQTFIGLVCGDRLYNRFLLYVMHTKTAELRAASTTGTIAYVSRRKFENLRVAIPPLEVQREIVRILDKFTDLEAELEAELEARRLQYFYYRDSLLGSAELGRGPWATLGEIYESSSGLSKGAEQFGFGQPFLSFKTVFHNATIPSELSDLVNSTEAEQARYSIKAGDVFVTRTSEDLEGLGMSCAALRDYPKATFNGFTKRLRPKADMVIDPEFAAHFFRSAGFRTQISRMAIQSTRVSLNNDILLRIRMPVPPMSDQHRIVEALNSFDALVNDPSIGLPAELAARRKQYEYYRDKLLTLQEAPA